MTDLYGYTMKDLREHLSWRGFGVRITTKPTGREADYFLLIKGKRVFCTFSNDKEELYRWESLRDFLAVFEVYIAELAERESIKHLGSDPWTKA